MTSEQADLMIAALGRVEFFLNALGTVGCYIFAAQLFRLMLQAKNSKNVL